MARGTTNRNARGSSQQRRKRKAWLVKTFGCKCFWCGKRLSKAAIEVDRWPVAGKDGGKYKSGNIVPSCARCNKLHDKRVEKLLDRLSFFTF